MSVPLDRLYQFVEYLANDLAPESVIIYRYSPHGSKKLENLNMLQDYSGPDLLCRPQIFCHDQEPLDYQSNQRAIDIKLAPNHQLSQYYTLMDQHGIERRKNIRQHLNIWDKCVLLHSEQRSDQVEQYRQDQYIPVYFFSHALIARDWFRYAQHVKQNKKVDRTFLIYNRAWTGTREYRLKFVDCLISQDLVKHCKTTFNPVDPESGTHYDQHRFVNPDWQPRQSLENVFPINQAHSHSSADFDLHDYETTDIEVVLETLFDDSRLHLTEKSLRPLACGQPFILAATKGSLEYLRGYGFQTFAQIWDESYDLIEDPYERLQAIGKLMQDIRGWSADQRHCGMRMAQAVAEHNRRHFFSEDFFDRVTSELTHNLGLALSELYQTNTSQRWFERRKQLCRIPELKKYQIELLFHQPGTVSHRSEVLSVVKRARLLRDQANKNVTTDAYK